MASCNQWQQFFSTVAVLSLSVLSNGVRADDLSESSVSFNSSPNLVQDPGFELGTSGFSAQDSSDYSGWSSYNPIDGSKDLMVYLKTWGSNVWWSLPVSQTPYANATSFTISAKVRGEVVSLNSVLEVCADTIYVGANSMVQSCVSAPQVAGVATGVSTTVQLDPTQTLSEVNIRLTLNGGTPVMYSIDDVSAVLNYGGVQPAPAPSPSPSVTPSPSPSPTTVPTGSLYGSRNETISKIYTVAAGNPCRSIADSSSANFTVRHFKMTGVTTQSPSAQGLRVGTYYDALLPGATQMCPGDQIFADVSIAAATPPGNYSVSVAGLIQAVHVWKSSIPTQPVLPLYSEITSNALLAGHNLDPNSNVSVLGPLAMSYVNDLRSNRMEPIKHYLSVPDVLANGTLDIDSWNQYSASFRQLVINNALGPVMIPTYFGSSASSRPTAAYLQAVQNMIVTNGLNGAWTYVWDEPQTINFAEIDARTAMIRAYAPSLKIMVTYEQTSSLVIDTFFPIMDWFNQPGHVAKSQYANAYGMYGSCTSHGSCTSGNPGALSGTPDLMLDDDPTNFVAYPMVIYASGAKSGLYYDTTYSYGNSDPWATQYQFGGNGDGNLFYPGRTGERGLTSNVPVDSYRMKMIRYGQYLNDYIAMSGQSQSVVTDAFHWSHTLSDYENLRMTIGTALDSRN